MAAAGAERRDLAFVVAPGKPGLVLRQGRVMELGLGEVGHRTPPRRFAPPLLMRGGEKDERFASDLIASDLMPPYPSSPAAARSAPRRSRRSRRRCHPRGAGRARWA